MTVEPEFGTPEWDKRQQARLAVIFAGGRAAECRHRQDSTGADYWQAETDAARIHLCDVLGDIENACYWRAYYIDRYGMLPEPEQAA